MIGFDACHIKGHHPGQLLSVVGVDPNNGMYPIAYAMAEVENYKTWSWFCQLLAEDLGIENNIGYVFITDKQKGLIDAVHDHFPNAEHRHYLKHLKANFLLASHRGLVLKLQIEKIARSTTIPWWDAEMKNMRQLSQAAFDWVAALDPSQWCRAHFKTHSKCDILLNNMCEAFNDALVEVRDKPILTMLERIRYYIMLLMATRRASCEKWKHAIGPRIFKILEKTKKESAWCIPKLARESLYEVKNHDGSQIVVDLARHSCSCRRWDITGIPCKHACAAIGQLNGDHIAYVDACYKKEAFMRAYSPMVHPMKSEDLWPKCHRSPLMPPLYHKQPGRTRKKRIRSAGEQPRKSNPTATKLERYNLETKCSLYRQGGHNRRSYPKTKEGSNNQICWKLASVLKLPNVLELHMVLKQPKLPKLPHLQKLPKHLKLAQLLKLAKLQKLPKKRGLSLLQRGLNFPKRRMVLKLCKALNLCKELNLCKLVQFLKLAKVLNLPKLPKLLKLCKDLNKVKDHHTILPVVQAKEVQISCQEEEIYQSEGFVRWLSALEI
ncbi:unnamed protein product, partial [Prunus brigantina]